MKSDKEKEKLAKDMAKDLRDDFMSLFGYCGVAESEKHIMLNTGNDIDIKIDIKW